ncbi:MAG: transcriptional repressor LexA [Planctomycetes bacterium]|nr:transcriptional repressor LexA [Planctomycetota bacterium]
MPTGTSKLTEALTPRQLQLLKIINNFKQSQYYSPTIAELAFELSVSRSTTFEHIAQLRKKELLLASPGRARSLELTSKAQKLLKQLNCKAAIETDNYFCENPQEGIPLVGKVAAGLPIEAIEDKSSLSLTSHFASQNEDTFALEVAGDSMVDDDIQNGDYVICRRSSTANNGQLVIALLDDQEATLKRFYREKNRVRLQPANDNYQPIYSDNCRIEAIVIGLVRKF